MKNIFVNKDKPNKDNNKVNYIISVTQDENIAITIIELIILRLLIIIMFLNLLNLTMI